MSEVDLSRVAWRKSRRSTSGGNCVEVAVSADHRLAVRDSKDTDGPKLVLTPSDWTAFVDTVKSGKFDL